MKYRMKTIRKWHNKCIYRSVWKRSEINALVKCLQSRNFSSKTNIFLQEYYAGLERISAYERLSKVQQLITKEQSNFGIEYLRRRYFKVNGQPRKNSPFAEYKHIIDNFKEFMFVGLYKHENNGSYKAYSPVYRIIAKDKSWVDYVPMHWGIPFVVASNTHIKVDYNEFVKSGVTYAERV